MKFWKGSHRRETIQRAFEDPYKQTPRASTVPAHTVPQITVSDRSEDEAGKARTFLKGVSKRTKKLGDGVTGYVLLSSWLAPILIFADLIGCRRTCRLLRYQVARQSDAQGKLSVKGGGGPGIT